MSGEKDVNESVAAVEEETEENAKMNDRPKKSKEEKSLIGKTVILDPRQGGMYVINDISLDEKSALVLNTFKGGRDRFVMESNMSQTMIKRGIKAGILRVLNENGKDVSIEFEGQSRYDPFKPIVTTAPKPVNPEVDKHLIEVLNTNDFAAIRDRIMLIKDRGALSRLLELEKKGENPAASARDYVITTLENVKKSLPGADSTVSVTEESPIALK